MTVTTKGGQRVLRNEGSDQQDAPIFIIGNPRSGTTLLRLMLTCHPDICVPPEAGFALWLEPRFHDWKSGDARLDEFLDALYQTRKFETWDLDRDSLTAYIRGVSPPDYASLVAAIYTHFADRNKPGWRRWGDKNNFYLEYIPNIHALFPRARFIHILRDPRDVACSYRELDQNPSDSAYKPKLPMGLEEIASEWRSNNQRIEDDLSQLNSSLRHTVRYEDLVENPRQTLRGICAFLDQAFHPAMLEYHAENREKALEPEEFMNWKTLTKSPPQTSRVGRYQRDLSQEQAALVVEKSEPVFGRYYGNRSPMQ